MPVVPSLQFVVVVGAPSPRSGQGRRRQRCAGDECRVSPGDCATDAERRDLFLTTARRLGTAVQNVEKDFWVCWTLDVLFNGLGEGQPRLLFKGGTSLSKSFGLIDRFSEDIDITVFRYDLGEPASIEDLEALSGKKRRARLDSIRTACQAFINGSFLTRFAEVMTDVMRSARVGADAVSRRG
jgi:hypothetical protein